MQKQNFTWSVFFYSPFNILRGRKGRVHENNWLACECRYTDKLNSKSGPDNSKIIFTNAYYNVAFLVLGETFILILDKYELTDKTMNAITVGNMDTNVQTDISPKSPI